MRKKIGQCAEYVRELAAGALRRLRGLRLSRAQLSRLGYYGGMAALLVILSAASCAYRDRAGAQPGVAPEAATQPVSAASGQQADAMEAPQPEATPWIWPLNGEILVPCSQNEPVWFASLGQWQIHAALDIAGAPGEAIRACGDGIVGEAWKDPLWGNSIRLEHADGFVSTYSNLNTLNLVQTGSAVMAGDVIGSVGRSAAVESELPWHLHFEMRCGDAAVDFERLMSGEAPDSGDGADSDADGSPGGSTGGAA